MPEWLFFGVMFLSLSVIPLIIFNRKWQQVGDLVAVSYTHLTLPTKLL
jgi:hypothetical protein